MPPVGPPGRFGSRSGSAEASPVDAVLADLVVDDARGGVEQARRLGAVAARHLERVLDEILLVGGERRRQVDPTTCEKDYSDEEITFMKAMDQYKRANRRPFPTWSEVLEVLRSLGYRRVAEPTALPGKKEPAVAARRRRHDDAVVNT